MVETVALLIIAAIVIRLVWVRARRVRPAHHPVDLGDVLARGKDKQRRFRRAEHLGQDGGIDETRPR